MCKTSRTDPVSCSSETTGSRTKQQQARCSRRLHTTTTSSCWCLGTSVSRVHRGVATNMSVPFRVTPYFSNIKESGYDMYNMYLVPGMTYRTLDRGRSSLHRFALSRDCRVLWISRHAYLAVGNSCHETKNVVRNLSKLRQVVTIAHVEEITI